MLLEPKIQHWEKSTINTRSVFARCFVCSVGRDDGAIVEVAGLRLGGGKKGAGDCATVLGGVTIFSSTEPL